MKRLILAACVALATTSVDAAPKEVVVASYGPSAKAPGIGRGPSYDSAKIATIQACLAHGGKMVCCGKLIRRLS
jgi:hypothetical protein